MKKQVTKEFKVVHVTVHYPDNTTERIDYVESHANNTALQLFDIDPDGWVASYPTHNDEPTLRFTRDIESRKIFSVDNFRKIETNWVEELVAVAEVEVVEEQYGFLGRKTGKKIAEGSNNPDVTIYEKHEWEAIEDEA